GAISALRGDRSRKNDFLVGTRHHADPRAPHRAGGRLPPRQRKREPGVHRRYRAERRAMAGREPHSQPQIPDHRDRVLQQGAPSRRGLAPPLPADAGRGARQARAQCRGLYHAHEAGRDRADHAGDRGVRRRLPAAHAAEQSGAGVLGASRRAAARHALNRQKQKVVRTKAITDVDLLAVDDEVLDILATWDQVAAAGTESDSSPVARAMIAGAFSLGNLRGGAFAQLPAARIEELLKRFEHVKTARGEVVIREGDEGDFYYVIEAG